MAASAAPPLLNKVAIRPVVRAGNADVLRAFSAGTPRFSLFSIAAIFSLAAKLLLLRLALTFAAL